MYNGAKLDSIMFLGEASCPMNTRLHTNCEYNLIGLKSLFKLTNAPLRSTTVNNKRQMIGLIDKTKGIWIYGKQGKVIKTLGVIPANFTVGPFETTQIQYFQVLPFDQGEVGILIGRETAINTGLYRTSTPEVPDVDSDSSTEDEEDNIQHEGYDEFLPSTGDRDDLITPEEVYIPNT